MSDAGPDAASFAATLVDWQRACGRQTLPWQQLGTTRDPYRVWLAEIMLQQTQVATVIPYYRRFLERFGDVEALARAPVDDVMHAWSGLGYYSRARNLHAAARRVVDEFGGRFPDSVEALATLPGVGRSTAGAIAAFAFGRRAAILDANVKRVFARLFLIEGASGGTAFTERAWAIAESMLPEAGIERYTQGLMDLGATICTPRDPKCLACPFEATCAAHRTGCETAYPSPLPRKARPERRVTLLLATRGAEVLLERRPPAGVWGGLWSLPEAFDRDAARARVDPLGVAEAVDDVEGFVHGFTHFTLRAHVVRVRLAPGTGRAVPSPDDPLAWIARDTIGSIGLPAPIRTLLTAA